MTVRIVMELTELTTKGGGEVKQISEKEHESCIAFYKLEDCNCSALEQRVVELEAEAKMGNVPYRTAIKWKEAIHNMKNISKEHDLPHDKRITLIADDALKEV